MCSQNIGNADFGFPAPDFWSSNQYPFSSQPLVADPPTGRVHQPLSNYHWMAPQPCHALNLSMNPPPATGFGKCHYNSLRFVPDMQSPGPVPRTISNANGLDGYVQPWNTNYFPPVVAQQVEPRYASFLSQGPPFLGQAIAPEPLAPVSVSGRGKYPVYLKLLNRTLTNYEQSPSPIRRISTGVLQARVTS